MNLAEMVKSVESMSLKQLLDVDKAGSSRDGGAVTPQQCGGKEQGETQLLYNNL